ncbi:hypothetical protein [Psychrobacillus sp. NPDC093180]|uniref:hypothetical protein n=1 Tax=Psychrobacillus sp. NPDC093180 TaxID=3364489 RepID=UPI0038152304
MNKIRNLYGKVVFRIPLVTEHVELKWVSRKKLAELKWTPADMPAVAKLIEITITN